MRIRTVEILSSPGIAHGFTVEGFGDGLTIIEGRNESGKSTLARAIRALMWPEPSQSLRARGLFEIEGREFRSYVETLGAGWQGRAPELPGASAGHGVVVGISDLWEADEHEHDIRRSMARELQGGYDIAALQAENKRKSPTGPMADLQKAEDMLAAARREARSLMAEEARLPELRSRAEALRSTIAQRHAIQTAIDRLKRLEGLAADEAQRDALPQGAFRVRGEEDRELARLDKTIHEARSASQREQRAAASDRQSIEALGLPDAGVSIADTKLLEDLANQASTLEQQIADAQREARRREGEAGEAAVGIQPLGREALAELDRALLAAQEARERRTRDRIAAERVQSGEPPRSARWPLIALAALIIAAVGSAVVAQAWLAVASGTLALFLAVYALMLGQKRSGNDGPDARQQAEDSERAYQAALASLRDISGEDDGSTSALDLVVTARRIAQHDAMMAAMLSARGAVEALHEQREDVLGRAQDVLRRYGRDGCTDADGLAAQVAELMSHDRERQRLAERAHSAIERADDHDRRGEEARQDRDRLLGRLGLTEDRLGELAEWLRLRQPAQRVIDRIRDHQSVLQSMEPVLAGAPELLDLGRTELATRLEACDAAQAELERILNEAGGIERAIAQSKRGADVSTALGEVDAAARAVAQARDEECAKVARQMILAHAVSGLQQEDMPALVQQADALLAQFTHNALGLHVDEQSLPVIMDHRVGEVRGYDELSTGTRAQALLATRLAGVIEAERRAGCPALPLILDEPLATSDEDRFEAISAAVLDLARQGRQLIYLTCEPAHAARLEALAEAHGVPCAPQNLDRLRGRQATDRVDRTALVEPKPAPSPKGVGREAYLAWRGVRPVDPWAGSQALDLYHLLPDRLETLHDLTMRGLRTLGQLRAVQRRGLDVSGWPELDGRASMAERLIDGWRRGRARPVTTQDLIDSEAAGAFLDRLADLNLELGGSARRLLEAIAERSDDRVKGFRHEKASDLRAFFERRGLLPSVEPLGRAEVLDQALAGMVMGSNTQESDRLLELANRLLDGLNAATPAESEAQGSSQA
jgi:energy-coupling factor transporter ATP-binding protein EcfA2